MTKFLIFIQLPFVLTQSRDKIALVGSNMKVSDCVRLYTHRRTVYPPPAPCMKSKGAFLPPK